MCEKLIAYLGNPKQQKDFRKAAVKRAKNYEANGIMERFVGDIDLKTN